MSIRWFGEKARDALPHFAGAPHKACKIGLSAYQDENIRLPQTVVSAMYHTWVKRYLDLILVVLAIVLLAPVLLLCALLVRLKLGAPILFRQQRPGLHGQAFTLFKFRTMLNKRNSQGNLLPDAERLTRFGRFLRATSLDELPELFNVLKGEMSLVGPRPLLMQYLPRYTPEQSRRHEVKPGITGWAQVNGRNAVTWDKKFAMDVWYVDNLSLWLDIKIILLTFRQIIQRKDINQPGHVTMTEFMGNVNSAPDGDKQRMP